ncbi:PREDICTED: solute carrier family 45 member 3-like [Priapulus caudatus]|uniref:Solute carrier family 45 member 3-like n=1 Tax=Priapulus caudatus TaxID=37621 RepID=A0ABM1ENS5_PRICU|nr:PREDICTED: solute carrier family 45 member 3-like [Priapulus caudatus]
MPAADSMVCTAVIGEDADSSLSEESSSVLVDVDVKRKYRTTTSVRRSMSASGAAPPLKRAPPLLNLILLNAVVCGLEFSASAIFTYVPPMLLKMGASDMFMTAIMGLGPLVGLFAVPHIGRASDRCTLAFGRRRPFIVGISAGVLVSLLLIPYAESIGVRVGGAHAHAVGLLLLCIGVVALDFCSQAAFNPCEALLSDMCTGTAAQDTAFTIYAFMLSAGGCVGYLVTALDWRGSQLGELLGTQERSAFALLIALFALTLLATLAVADDRPYTRRRRGQRTGVATESEEDATPSHAGAESGYETNSNQGRVTPDAERDAASPADPLLPGGATATPARRRSFHRIKLFRLDRIRSQMCRSIAGRVIASAASALYSPVSNFARTPTVLRRLFCSHVLTWTAIMCHNMFYTEFVGHIVYAGDPNMAAGTPERELYDQGERRALVYFCDTPASRASNKKQQQPRGVGSNMAVLDSAYFLAQILLSAFMGYVVHLTGTALSYVVSSSLIGCLACYKATHVIFKKSDMIG